MFLFKRRNTIVQRAKSQLRTAVPQLTSLLSTEITYLESLETQEDEGIAIKEAYPKRRLVSVLKAAANVHLKLKLDGPKGSQIALLRYLNPSDVSQQGFSASCLRLMNMSEGVEELRLTELKGLYIYLLSRLD